MTVNNNTTTMTAQQAREALIARLAIMTPEEITAGVADLTAEHGPVVAGETEHGYITRVLTNLPDEVALAAVQMVLDEQHPVQLSLDVETTTVPASEVPQYVLDKAPAQVPPTSTLSPVDAPLPTPVAHLPKWYTDAVDRMRVLNKTHFTMQLKHERIQATDAAIKDAITARINALEKDDAYWANTAIYQIMSLKKWDDSKPGVVGDALYTAGGATQVGVSKSTAWLGKQLIKAGTSMVENADTVGKVVASPLTGMARLFAKKPTVQGGTNPVTPTPTNPAPRVQ